MAPVCSTRPGELGCLPLMCLYLEHDVLTHGKELSLLFVNPYSHSVVFQLETNHSLPHPIPQGHAVVFCG